MSELRASDLAPGLFLGPDVDLGDRLDIGAHVVIHAGVRVGDGCTLQDGAIVGKAPRLGPRSRTAGPGGATLIEDGATVCCHAVVCAGARIAEGAIVGDGAFVRERAEIGAGTVVGTRSAIGPGVIVGSRARLWTNAMVAPGTIIEDEVDFAIGAATTSRRWEPGGEPGEVRIRRRAKVGVYAIVLAGVEIGEEAVVGAGSLVNEDVAAGQRGGGHPREAHQKVNGPGCRNPGPSLNRSGSGEPRTAEPAPIVSLN